MEKIIKYRKVLKQMLYKGSITKKEYNNELKWARDVIDQKEIRELKNEIDKKFK